ncbi:hypothetical protein AYK24_03150 [Thermoplasmatales archaeon SG8-52-4]|nr:MAG: hypothetical protein AYK24_03150 [Thermoplasmatales archaeon SG8-52-4]
MNKILSKNIKVINTCYNHVGGLLGEAILRFFLKEELIKRLDNEYIITEKGWDELEIIGIDIEKLRSNNRKIVNVCIESNHGILYEHIGSFLGTTLMEKMLELGWIKKKDEKIFELTEKGITGLESFGVNIKTFV